MSLICSSKAATTQQNPPNQQLANMNAEQFFFEHECFLKWVSFFQVFVHPLPCGAKSQQVAFWR